MAFLLELEDQPIIINRRGQWFHGHEPLHPKVERLFRHHVAVDQEGHYMIQLQFRRAPLHVEDTAFSVRSIRIDVGPAGLLRRVRLLLSDGAEENLNPTTLMQAEDNTLYCHIHRSGWKVPCRFTPHQYHELALHGRADKEGPYFPFGNMKVRPALYHGAPVPE